MNIEHVVQNNLTLLGMAFRTIKLFINMRYASGELCAEHW